MNYSVLLLNVQTAPKAASYAALGAIERSLWDEKNNYWTKQGLDPDVAYARYGAIQAEFGQIVAISMGFASIRDSALKELRLHILSSQTEHKLLTDFITALPPKRNYTLCAHNGREFAYPYLCRRLIANRLPLPAVLQVQDKKPWELQHLEDTFALWQFGDRKHHTSLALLCHTLGLPIATADISEEEVCTYYHDKVDLNSIGQLAEAQLINTLQVYLRLKGLGDAPKPLPITPYV